ncbi:MAG TPA: DUF4381 domain-containing protein [Rhodanobacteraceae bacterium]
MTVAGPTLRDIHLPTAAWWPLAPAWWMVVAVLAASIIAIIAWAWIHRRRRALRAALREIDAWQREQQHAPDVRALAAQASALMRRVARHVEPGVASRDGAAWRGFVGRYARTAATREVLQHLLDERYRRAPTLDAATLLPALRLWCRAALGHRTGASAARGSSLQAHA